MMATGKRYYWIKLKDTFMTSDAVDFLMGQKDGANYVVLYQMLCLKTINTGGRLERTIGEVIIPYDVEKIQRDTKWFTIDTVRIALNLYKSLGLIYADDNGVLCLAGYENLVGSETDWALQKRNQREELPPAECGQCPPDVHQNVHTDIRYKDNRYKEIDIRDKEINNNTPLPPSRGKGVFVKPSVDEVKAYCEERNNGIDAEAFIDFYESKGWKIGKDSMKDWKAAVRNWERRHGNAGTGKQSGTPGGTSKVQGKYDGVNFYDNV